MTSPATARRSTLEARPVDIHGLALTETPDADHAVFEAECGKGTYVRALGARYRAAFSAVSAMSRRCAAPKSAHSAKTT